METQKSTFTSTIIATIAATILSAVINFYVQDFLSKPDFEVRTRVCVPSSQDFFLVDALSLKKTEVTGQMPAPVSITFINTGKKALKDVTFYIEFIPRENSDFTLQGSAIFTVPEKGFGPLTLTDKSASEKSISVTLFNPGDEIILTGLGSNPTDVRTYAKVDGFTLNNYTEPICQH